MTLSTPPPPSVIKKTLSCTFLFVFLTTSLTPPYVEASIGKFRNTERSSHFSIPPTLANVSETYWPLVNGPEPLTVKGRVFPFVLHIQDAHEIFEAQKALSTLLETLQQQNQLPKVLCVEGAWGKIDLSWIRNIPEEEAKRRLADRLLKEGLMTGEEHFASLCEPPVPVVGVDDAILHGKNAKARAAIAEDTRLVTSVIQDARYQLSLLEKKRLSPPLFEFLNARKKWENDAGHIKEYTGALSRMWGKDEFNTLWPTLDRFQEMATLEPIVLAQKEDLLRSVRKTEDIDQIDPRVVRDILRYRTLAQETNPHEILKETARCDRETMNKIAVSGTLEERRLAELDEWLALTEKLWALAMTPDDWERYQQIRPHWGREKMAKTLRDFTILPWPQRADGQERFWNGLVHAEDFYRVALERNEALARSTMETARQFNGQAVLIAGGFHSPGMAKLFRESGSSYAIVAPDFQQNTENHLRKVSALFAPNEDQRQRIEQDLTTLFPPGKARELSDQFEKRALPGSHRKKRSFLSPAWVHGAVVATVIAFRVLLWMTVAPLALAADGGGGVDALLTATAVVPLVLELAVALGRRTLKPATDPNTDAPSPPPTETPSLSQLISNKLFDEALTLIRKRFVTDEISAGRLFLELNDDEKQTLMENAPWDSNEKGLLMACVWQAARQKDIRDQRKLLSLQKEISQKTSRPSEAVKEITEQIRILNEQLDAMQALQSHFETFADQGEIPLWCREFLKTLTETEKKARATALEWRLAFVKSPETLPTDVVREETKGMTVFLRALLSPAPVLRLSDRRAWADSYLWAKESSKLYWLYHVPQFGRLESNAMTAAWKAARRPPAGLSPVPPPRKEDVGSFEEIVKSARGNLHNNVLDNKALVVLPEPEDILAFTTELARQEHNTDRSRKTYLFDLGVYWRNHSQDIPERNGLVEVMDLLAQRGNAVLVINMENFRYEDATLVETALKIREKKGPPVVLAVGRHTMNSQLKPDRLSHIAGITEIPEDQRRARLTDGLQREIQGISDEQGTPLPSQDLLQDLDLGPFLGLPDLLAKLRRLFEEMAASQTRDRAFLTTRNRMSAFLERMRAEPPTGPRAAELQRKIEGLQQQLLVSEPRTLALGVTKERRPTDAQIVQSALYAMASDLPFVEQVTLALTRMPPDAAVQVRRFLSEYTQYLRSQSTQEATKRLGWLQSALQLFPLLPPDQPTPLSGEEDIYDRAARLLGLSHSGTSAMLDFINRQITAQLLAEKGATRTLPTALLLGPHGTGKTTLTKSMATILRRKLVFLSLGNITDTRQAAGHSSVYQGAVDGTLAQKIRLLLSAWALVVLDEIDKAPMDVQNLFLPVFDFQRAFYDNFYAFNLPIERLMFIATANYADRISGPLLDRMVVIRLPGYVREEKIKIALHYILPNIFQKYGITNDEVAIPDVQGLLDHLLSHHDFEPGVRRLETLLEAVVVGAAIDWVKSSRSNAIVLTPDQAQNYLPPPHERPPADTRQGPRGRCAFSFSRAHSPRLGGQEKRS